MRSRAAASAPPGTAVGTLALGVDPTTTGGSYVGFKANVTVTLVAANVAIFSTAQHLLVGHAYEGGLTAVREPQSLEICLSGDRRPIIACSSVSWRAPWLGVGHAARGVSGGSSRRSSLWAPWLGVDDAAVGVVDEDRY